MRSQLIVTLDSELKRKFRIKCINEKKTMTDIIILLIKRYIKEETHDN